MFKFWKKKQLNCPWPTPIDGGGGGRVVLQRSPELTDSLIHLLNMTEVSVSIVRSVASSW